MIDEEDKGDNDIYSGQGREELTDEDDSITNVDEGFMQGYDEEEKLTECSSCQSILEGNHIVEEEFDGVLHRFCSTECAITFEEKKKNTQ